MYLFSYGSNHPTQLANRLGHKPAFMKGAVLDGYVRVFRGFSTTWQGGVASLEKKRGGQVFGYVSSVSQEDLKTLDRYEGVALGRYKRTNVTVTTVEEEELRAVAYVSLSEDFNQPSQSYLEAVAKTIAAFWKNTSGKTPTAKDITIR